MTDPSTLKSFAANLYDRLAPVAHQDAANNYDLASFLGSIGEMFQIVDDYGRDQVDENGLLAPGWSQLLDINRCPPEALSWLGQFVGVALPDGLDDATARARISGLSGWSRGTLQSIIAAAQSQLLGSYGDGIMYYNPDAYWPLADATGQLVAVDASGNGHPGTLSSLVHVLMGQTPVVDGTHACSFDGSGNINIPTFSPWKQGTAHTWMGWANLASSAASRGIIGGSAGADMQFSTVAGGLNLTYRPSSGASQTWTAAVPALNTWFHWTLTYNDVTKVSELYINAVTQGTKTHSAGFQANSTGTMISPSFPTNFSGLMQAVAHFPVILSPSAISAIYTARTITGGGKHVTIRERDPAASASLPAYGLTVQTLTRETPNSAALLAAILAQKPAGIVLNFQVLAGWDYQGLFTGEAAYSNVFSGFNTYQGVINDIPGT